MGAARPRDDVIDDIGSVGVHMQHDSSRHTATNPFGTSPIPHNGDLHNGDLRRDARRPRSRSGNIAAYSAGVQMIDSNVQRHVPGSAR
jgi:hypothetical protein